MQKKIQNDKTKSLCAFLHENYLLLFIIYIIISNFATLNSNLLRSIKKNILMNFFVLNMYHFLEQIFSK